MSTTKFTNMKILFLILRKNTKLLKEYVSAVGAGRVRCNRRQHIIFMKSQLASLPMKKYNLLKTIATDVNRFDILTPVRAFDQSSEVVRLMIPETDIVLKSFHNSVQIMRGMYRSSAFGETVDDPDPRILHDKILNHYFILEAKQTTIQNVVLFGGSDHAWFEDVYNAIKDAKDAEEEIMRQQKIMEELRVVEKFKEGILDKYS